MIEARPCTSIPTGPAAIATHARRPRVVAVAIAALVLSGAGAVGCSSSGSATKKTTDTTTTTVPTTTTAAPTTTTVPPTTSAPATTAAPAPATTAPTHTPSVTAVPAQCAEAGAEQANPDPAAQAVFIAWTRGDRACAAELMAPKALDSLFVRDGSGATDRFQGCEKTAAATVDCAFTYEGGATHYKMVFGTAGRWKVEEVYQVAD